MGQNFNPNFFKIISGVTSHREGYKTIKIELDKDASDWLCKAMALQVSQTAKGDADLLPQMEQLQLEIVKAWEAFRPV